MYVKLEKPKWEASMGLYKKLDISPRRLLEVFGEPTDGEVSPDGKVTKVWMFQDSLHSRIFAIWDFKETAEYDSGLPSKEEFWKSHESIPFSICSGNHNAPFYSEEFLTWVKKMVS